MWSLSMIVCEIAETVGVILEEIGIQYCKWWVKCSMLPFSTAEEHCDVPVIKGGKSLCTTI